MPGHADTLTDLYYHRRASRNLTFDMFLFEKHPRPQESLVTQDSCGSRA